MQENRFFLIHLSFMKQLAIITYRFLQSSMDCYFLGNQLISETGHLHDELYLSLCWQVIQMDDSIKSVNQLKAHGLDAFVYWAVWRIHGADEPEIRRKMCRAAD